MSEVLRRLASGELGVRWTPPPGEVLNATDHEVILRDAGGLVWTALASPLPFALGADGGDPALIEDLDASARASFEEHWRSRPRLSVGDEPRTADPSWTPLVESTVLTSGPARCLRVVRRLAYEPGEEIVVGDVVAPTPRGTLELRVQARAVTTGLRESTVVAGLAAPRAQPQAAYDARERDVDFPDHPLTRVRAALDVAVAALGLSAVPAPRREVELPALRCAFVAPPRFVAFGAPMAAGLQGFYRAGLDGWKRLLDVWRIGDSRIRDLDPRPALAEAADRIVNDWTKEGCDQIQLETRFLDAFVNRPQIEQYVRFRGRGAPTHTLHRWWIEPDGTCYRIGSNGPPNLTRAALAADLDAVQASWRRP